MGLGLLNPYRVVGVGAEAGGEVGFPNNDGGIGGEGDDGVVGFRLNPPGLNLGPEREVEGADGGAPKRLEGAEG